MSRPDLEVRYTRAFLLDLQHLDRSNFERISEFVFIKFMQVDRLYDLPELHQLVTHPIFYRFQLGEYLIIIEVSGHFVKFLRILPVPTTFSEFKHE